jgi:hypothetical protein
VKLRVVPRAPGDTAPLDPAVADALRRAGIDPMKFTTAPGEPTDALGALPKSGARLGHSFRFLQLADALRALERLLDDDTEARVSKVSDGWLVVFDTPADPSLDDTAAHQRIAAIASELGAEDRGLIRETIAVR